MSIAKDRLQGAVTCLQDVTGEQTDISQMSVAQLEQELLRLNAVLMGKYSTQHQKLLDLEESVGELTSRNEYLEAKLRPVLEAESKAKQARDQLLDRFCATEFMGISARTHSLWDHITIKEIPDGFSLSFPNAFYMENKETCSAFLKSLKDRAATKKKYSAFQSGQLIIKVPIKSE